MIRNPWRWLRQLESVMVHHTRELKQQRDLNDAQARVNKATNTTVTAQTAIIGQLHARVSELEAAGKSDHIVRIYPGPYSDHGKEQC